MEYFPIFLNLTDRQIVVIGGGEVACRKVELLLRAKANICLVSPVLHPFLAKQVSEQKIHYKKKNYQLADIKNADLIWATTNLAALNQQIYTDAKNLGIWVNVVDDPTHCDFITPSIVDRSPIQIAISSSGKSPVLIRYLREKLESYLGQNLALIAQFAGEKRELIKQKFNHIDERRKFWEQFLRLPAVEQATNKPQLESAFNLLLSTHNSLTATTTFVHVGQDPELLTLKALRYMQQAELVLVENALPEIFLDLCRRDANRAFFSNENALKNQLAQATKNCRICVLFAKKPFIAANLTDRAVLYLNANDAK